MNTTIIKSGSHENCELCRKEDDLRPYGPNGEWICFDCGMKNEKAPSVAFGNILRKGSVIIDLTIK